MAVESPELAEAIIFTDISCLMGDPRQGTELSNPRESVVYVGKAAKKQANKQQN